MNKILSKRRTAAVTATSERSRLQDVEFDARFDFSLLATSWDERCVALSKGSNFKSDAACVLWPNGRDDSGLRDRHDKEIQSFLTKNVDHWNLCQFDSSQIDRSWQSVKRHFLEYIKLNDGRKPIKMYIDASSCPRYISLALLRFALQSGVCSEVVLGYSEGIYPNKPTSYRELDEVEFSFGQYNSYAIPGYLGDYEPGNMKIYCVSIGFDGHKTLNLISRKEPDKVAVLLASPGVIPSYEDRTMTANQSLIEKFITDSDDIMKSPAGDAINAWNVLASSKIFSESEGNIYLLGAGNKPHSLAMALLAIELRTPTLLYSSPSRHKPVEVLCGENFWIYRISQNFRIYSP